MYRGVVWRGDVYFRSVFSCIVSECIEREWFIYYNVLLVIGRDIMGELPSTIFREIYKRTSERHRKAESIEGGVNPVFEMSKEDGCFYVPYKEVLQRFIIAGYSEKKATARIQDWVNNDLLYVRYSNGYKYIGFSKDGIL